MNKIGKINIDNLSKYNDLLVIDTNNSKNILKEIYDHGETDDQPAIILNNKEYFLEDILIIDSFNTIGDFYNFKSKNQLTYFLNENKEWNKESVFNTKIIENLKNQLNEIVGINEYIDVEIEFSKLYKTIFKIKNNKFIDSKSLIKWLKNEKVSKPKLIIINEIEDISIRELFLLTDKYKFIVLTNNIFNHCNKIEDLELCSFYYNKLITCITESSIFYSWMKKYFNLKNDEIEDILSFKNDIFRYFELKKRFLL